MQHCFPHLWELQKIVLYSFILPPTQTPHVQSLMDLHIQQISSPFYIPGFELGNRNTVIKKLGMVPVLIGFTANGLSHGNILVPDWGDMRTQLR